MSWQHTLEYVTMKFLDINPYCVNNVDYVNNVNHVEVEGGQEEEKARQDSL